MKNDVTKLELWKARIKNFLRGDFLRSKKLTPTMQMIVSIAQCYDANGICFVARNVYNIQNRFGRDLSFLRRFKVVSFLILGDEYENMVTVFYAIDINSDNIIDKIHKAYNESKCMFFICKNEDEYKMILQKLQSEEIKVLFDGNGEGGEYITICDKVVSESINNRLSKIATSLNAPCNDDGGLKNESLLMKIQAIVTCYNEEDIIEHTIKYLVEQGIYVHVVDNWSTDDSWDIVQKYVQRSRFVTSEKFPTDGPSETYDWGNILCRVQEIAMNNSDNFDWFVHHDADEVREAPFESIAHLRDGIIIADRCGFNAIDYTVINFVPIPDSYNGTQDITQYLRYCSFGNQYGDMKQVKTWKSCDNINLVDSSGHHVQFIGKEQKIFPYKFLLRHYSLRSKEQAQRKIFKDRKPRWNKQELKKQWHTHYNKINNSRDLEWNKEDYLFFEREIFYKTYMMQMITGAGVQIEEVKRNK